MGKYDGLKLFANTSSSVEICNLSGLTLFVGKNHDEAFEKFTMTDRYMLNSDRSLISLNEITRGYIEVPRVSRADLQFVVVGDLGKLSIEGDIRRARLPTLFLKDSLIYSLKFGNLTAGMENQVSFDITAVNRYK